LICALCSSKTRKVQLDLSGNELRANEWRVLGFIDACFLESIGTDDLEQWTIRFTPKQMDKVFAEWDNSRH
jgi:hypothetical protein